MGRSSVQLLVGVVVAGRHSFVEIAVFFAREFLAI